MYVLKPKYAVFWLWLCWYSKFLGKIVDFGGIVLTENHVSTPHLRREVQSAAINTTVYTVNAKHDYVLALESTTAYNRRARVPFSPHFISAKCSRNRFTCVERERESAGFYRRAISMPATGWAAGNYVADWHSKYKKTAREHEYAVKRTIITVISRRQLTSYDPAPNSSPLCLSSFIPARL